jgi:DNA-binding MurR/RpiR family transcriptional regulator
MFQVDEDRFTVSGFDETKVTGVSMKQLDERLRASWALFSPQEQRVASFIVDHFDDLISYNSAELARLSGVSKATVSRLFKRLGYERYKDMREELRTLRQSGMPLTENRDAVQGNTLLARHYKQEMANLTQLVNQLEASPFAEVVNALVNGKRIFIIGMRNSWPVAMHLRQQLLQVRSGVSLLPQPGQTLAEELVDIGPEDCVVTVAFRRRPRIIKPLLASLQQRGIPLVVLSESASSGLATYSRWHLSAPLDSVSAFDSYSSAMSLVNLLANAVLHESLTSGRQRIHNIAELYTELDELEQR